MISNMKWLYLFSLAFVIILPTQFKAQDAFAAVSSLCLNESGTTLSWPTTTGCAAPLKEIQLSSVPDNFKAVCLVLVESSNVYQIFNADSNPAGTSHNCDKYKQDTKYAGSELILRTQIGGKDPASTTTTTTTTTPSTTKTTPKTTTKTSTTTGSQGSCPENFTQKGPLCIPNNPFANSDGIAGKGTIGELAASIIRILLYLSGIVAVIMIIVGGYTWMTARGNETQATDGRKTLINALIGLVIVVMAYAIVQAITNYIIKGT